MKKISEFIVDKRIFVFLLFVVLVVISFFGAANVKINRDITKYLPSTSEVRVGMDIMEEEFKEETSTLNIMFKGLKQKERNKIYEELKDFENVKEVLFEDNEDYVVKDKTLYKITASVPKESKKAKKLYADITKKYEDYEIETSGDLADEYKVVLPIWIVILAIACALVILILMCESYIEPFLFLIGIGMGVFLNKGTNIIFPTISSITDSIAAILQLALSMDYSIMLMNRYRQEKEQEKDNVVAMKKALYKSFLSISSSSVTTIVGLIALVFMSFTIGRDLGFVLAKGVLFSLITIFTCLPFLILTFDKLITKTKKKAPVFKLDKLGNFAYKFRYVGIGVFLLVFIVSYLLKGNLEILYTDSDASEIKDIFDTNNQIALIYDKKYEDVITKYCQSLEQDGKIDEVLCYGNTINEKTLYQNLNQKLSDLGNDSTIENYLLKIIYYNYYNKKTAKMTLQEFVSFIKSDVYNNKNMDDKLDSKMKNDLERLSNFTDNNKFESKRSAQEIATLLEIDEDSVKDLLIYYNSLNNTTKLNVREFVEFMDNYVLQSKYKSSVDKEAVSKLALIKPFVREESLMTPLTSIEMAKVLGMDENIVKNIYSYYASKKEANVKMTLQELADFVINNILSNPSYAGSINAQDMQVKLEMLKTFSNKEFINEPRNYQEIANIGLGINEEMAKRIYIMYFSNVDNEEALTIREIVQTGLALKNNLEYADKDFSWVELLASNEELMNSPKTYTAWELATLLGVDSENFYSIYVMNDFMNNNTDNYKLTIREVINYLVQVSEVSPEIREVLGKEGINNLNTLALIINSTWENKSYTYQEIANMNLGIDEATAKLIYSLYEATKEEVKLTPYQMVNFLVENKDNPLFKEQLSTRIKELETLQRISQSVIKKEVFTSNELAQLLGIDKEKMELLYALYNVNYKNEEVNISYADFVDFLLEDVVTNEKYSSNFDQDKVKRLQIVKGIMKATNDEVKYSNDEVFTILTGLADDKLDKDLIELLYMYYGSEKSYDNTWTMTVEEFINYLHDDILQDERFTDFIDTDMRKRVKDAKVNIDDAKKLLVGKKYNRMVLNTSYDLEGKTTFNFMKKIRNDLELEKGRDVYFIGNTPMAYEMNKTFNKELNFITFLTILFIFVIVAITFKSLLIPLILVILIQTAVFMTMGIMTFEGGTVYFIALLIVQSILMGATIDYAILYTSYYLELRGKHSIKEALIMAYNNSIHTILTSASILSLVTLVIGYFGSATAAKICKTISQGTICSTILILLLLPELIASLDKFIVKKRAN